MMNTFSHHHAVFFLQQQTEQTRRRLESLAQAQSAEATKLRHEIHRLTRKVGHVLPPSPVRPSSVDKLPPLDQRS